MMFWDLRCALARAGSFEEKLDLQRPTVQRESLGPAIRSLTLSFEEKLDLRWSKVETESLGPAIYMLPMEQILRKRSSSSGQR